MNIKRLRRWLLPALMLAAGATLTLFLFAPRTQAAAPAQSSPRSATPNDVNRVAKQLYCPVCPNTPLNVCETQACKDWRELIRQKLAAGSSDQEIVDYFVAQYGQRVLAAPPAEGFNLLVWIIPAVALIAGAVGLAVVLRSWLNRRRAPQALADQPAHSRQATGLPEDYVARIEREMQTRS